MTEPDGPDEQVPNRADRDDDWATAETMAR